MSGATITTSVTINNKTEMARRFEKKNTKAQLARALAEIWDASRKNDNLHLEKVVNKTTSDAVWGY